MNKTWEKLSRVNHVEWSTSILFFSACLLFFKCFCLVGVSLFLISSHTIYTLWLIKSRIRFANEYHQFVAHCFALISFLSFCTAVLIWPIFNAHATSFDSLGSGYTFAYTIDWGGRVRNKTKTKNKKERREKKAPRKSNLWNVIWNLYI